MPKKRELTYTMKRTKLDLCIPVVSYGGDTSTKSQPTIFNLLHPRTISNPWIEVRPPISGVPVPGAKLGSNPSMSKL